jgi:hypothetical protein
MSRRLKRYRRKTMTRALKVPAPIFTIDRSDIPGSFQRSYLTQMLPGGTITAEAEVEDVRQRKPVAGLRTTMRRLGTLPEAWISSVWPG